MQIEIKHPCVWGVDLGAFSPPQTFTYQERNIRHGALDQALCYFSTGSWDQVPTFSENLFKDSAIMEEKFHAENHLQLPSRLKSALECYVGLMPSLTASLRMGGGSSPSKGASVRLLETLDLFQLLSISRKRRLSPPIAFPLLQGKLLHRIIITWSTHPPRDRLYAQPHSSDFFNQSKTITS